MMVKNYITHNISRLTQWGRVTHICVSKLTTIGSDNGLSPGRRQAIILTKAGILLIGPLGINFSENLIAIYTFSFKKMHLKITSGKWLPFCVDLNVLRTWWPKLSHMTTDITWTNQIAWYMDQSDCMIHGSIHLIAWYIWLTTNTDNMVTCLYQSIVSIYIDGSIQNRHDHV